MNIYHKLALFAVSVFAVLAPRVALAHCPLCTAGAVALGIGAYKLGVSTLSVGISIGAFSIALGLWVARLIKRKYIPYQWEIIVILSFATTVLPIIKFMPGYTSIYIPSIGEYGATYMISLFLIGSLVGGILMFVAPSVSRKVTNIVGSRVPYQGLSITLALLIAAIVIAEFAL
jgi:hypothetical protein